MRRDGSDTPRSFPLAVVGERQRAGSVIVTVYDEEAWDATADEKKRELYDTAMMYGTVEYHKRMPIATIVRGE